MGRPSDQSATNVRTTDYPDLGEGTNQLSLEAMRAMMTPKMSIHLGMPDFHSALGRSGPRN